MTSSYYMHTHFIAITMNQHSGTLKVRESFRKQIRKKQLQKQFEEHRKNWKNDHSKGQEEEFYRLYPEINEHNAQQYIPFILNYSSNNSYNFMLLPLIGYVYQQMLINPQAEQPYLILEVMTQYEQIDLPQTEEFVMILLQSLLNRTKVVLNIIVNLLEHHRYAQILRDLLLEADFLIKGQQMVSSYIQNDFEGTKIQVSLFFCICCQFVKSHPPVPFKLFCDITNTLANLMSGQEEKYFLFETLSNIGSTFRPDFHIAEHLFKLFHMIAVQQYYTYEHQITQFLTYCLLSNVSIENYFQKQIIGSLQSHSQTILSKSLLIFQLKLKQLNEFEKREQYEELKQVGFFERINKLCLISKKQIQKQCLQCYQILVPWIVIDQNSQEVESLISLISFELQTCHTDLLVKALNIFLEALKTMLSQQLELSCILAFIQRQGLISKLLQLNSSNQQVDQIIQIILKIIDPIQRSIL